MYKTESIVLRLLILKGVVRLRSLNEWEKIGRYVIWILSR